MIVDDFDSIRQVLAQLEKEKLAIVNAPMPEVQPSYDWSGHTIYESSLGYLAPNSDAAFCC